MDFAESASKYGLESRSAMRTFIRCLVFELNSTELNVGLVSLKSQVSYTVTKNIPLETQIINRNLVSRMILENVIFFVYFAGHAALHISLY